MDLIKTLLAKGANPNARVNTHPVPRLRSGQRKLGQLRWPDRAFIRAALNGDVTLMRLLLEHGADPNMATNEGSTALWRAAGVNWVVAQTSSRSDNEYLEAARLCLEKGADVNAVNRQGFTAMIRRTNRGFDAMVKLLAEHGSAGCEDKQGRTPMTFAEGVFLGWFSRLFGSRPR